jgi:hypothetical protein
VLRYQLGDWQPYIYKTEDYGKRWTFITNGINTDYPVRVVREDPEKEGLLFAGTEFGLFISYDDGNSWDQFQLNLPVTPITDMKLHRNDLVISTMGRGFWILDNVSVLREHESNTNYLYVPKKSIRYTFPYYRSLGNGPEFERQGILIDYYLQKKPNGPVQLVILDENQKLVNSYSSDSIDSNESWERDMATNEFSYSVNNSLTKNKGLNRFRWDMTYPGPWHSSKIRRHQNGPLVAPGQYTAIFLTENDSLSQTFELVLNPTVADEGITTSIIKEQIELELKVRDLLSEVRKLESQLEKELKSNPTGERNKIIKNALNKIQSKDEIYPMPMLASQVSYLYSMITDADQKPGMDAYKRFEELLSQFDEINASLR